MIAIQQWEIPSSTKPGKVYTVKKWQDGTFSCDCPAWVFKRKNQERQCTHTLAMQTLFAAGAANGFGPPVQPGQPRRIPRKKKPEGTTGRRFRFE